MINETKTLDTSQTITEESIPIDKDLVEFQREWVLWENYQMKDGKSIPWEESIKQIVSFKDVITFWQFWNNYHCANPKNFIFDGERFAYFFIEKKRIDGLNLFSKGISPKWEDSNNLGGRILNLLYDIKEEFEEFLSAIEKVWLEIVLMLIGESLPASRFVNGIRLIDKSKFKYKSMYRIEVWLSPSVNREENQEEFLKLKEFLKETCGSTVEDKEIKL
jgi:hypothetical protein